MKPSFTYTYYTHMLQALKDAGYDFCSFADAMEPRLERLLGTTTKGRKWGADPEQPLVVLRHDIDQEPQAAEAIAKIEYNMGINSTYFFMVSCPLYNIFDVKIRKLIENIYNVGHHIGLHFNYPAYKAKHASVAITEAELLDKIAMVSAISLHQPDMKMAKTMQLPWPHTYEPAFINGQFTYFADSGGVWEHGGPLESDAFKERRNMQILTHPIWWQKVEGGSPRWRLELLMERIKDRTREYLETNCPRGWARY